MKKTIASSVLAMLLAIVAASAALAAPAVKAAVPFKGTWQATETDSVPPPFDTLYVDGYGSGNASHLGQYTVHFTSVVSTATLSGPDLATFVAANGDQLFATGLGQATTADFVSFDIIEHYTITGGTGRFAGAAGSFIVVRQLYAPNGVSVGEFDGTIALAHGQ